MSDSTREPEGSARRAGEVCEGFELLEFVAEGPFSEVWRARRGDEFAALKFARGEVGERMLAEEASVLEGLARRNRAVLRLSDSPNRLYPQVAVGALHFVPRAGDRGSCLATLWIPHGSLRRRLASCETPDQRARVAAVFCDLVEAVGIIHSQGIVHGDLKPENVLLHRSGEGEVPYVVDFGLARYLRQARLEQSLKASLQTEDALTGGTLAYMAPEIVKGGEPSAQGDVYALGVMLHEALTGRRPSKVTTPEELKRKVPAALIPILLKALAYEPSERYLTARAFANELAQERTALSATGLSRVARGLARFVLGGLAACFVALRYLSVAVLITTYASILVGALVGAFVFEPIALFWLILFVPVVLLHGVIRWEGPESQEEAAARNQGQVVEARERHLQQRLRSNSLKGPRGFRRAKDL